MHALISLNSSRILNIEQKNKHVERNIYVWIYTHIHVVYASFLIVIVYRNLKVSNNVALRNKILLGDIKHRRLMLQK